MNHAKVPESRTCMYLGGVSAVLTETGECGHQEGKKKERKKGTNERKKKEKKESSAATAVSHAKVPERRTCMHLDGVSAVLTETGMCRRHVVTLRGGASNSPLITHRPFRLGLKDFRSHST